MATAQTYRDRGLPNSLLGSTWRKWSMDDIEDVLWHYKKSYMPSKQKIGMWAQLNDVVRIHQLEGKFQHKHLLIKEVNTSQARTGLKRPGAHSPLKEKRKILEEYTTTKLAKGPDGSNITCTVCLEDFPSADAPVRITASCKHDPSICRECLSTSITVQLQSKFWNQIGCPSCNLVLDHHDVQMFATTATFSRYDELSRGEALDKDSSFRPCATPSCPYGGWCNPTLESFFTCPTCTQRTCTSCETHWHTGISCEDNIAAQRLARQQEVEATEKMLDQAKNYKTCPNKDCAARVLKVSGCDHMTCSRCRYEYCWLCFADYKAIRKNGNHFHAATCLYFAAIGGSARPIAPIAPIARLHVRIEDGQQDPRPENLNPINPAPNNPVVGTTGMVVPDAMQGVVRDPVVENAVVRERAVEEQLPRLATTLAANPVVASLLARIRGSS